MNVRHHHPRPRSMHPARSPGIAMPSLNAMRTAARVFAATSTRAELLDTAAHALATQPGHMCLVSLVDGEELRPASVAHVLAPMAVELRGALPRLEEPSLADAFSRAAQHNGAALRMSIRNPAQLQLWLPAAFREYAERVRVSAVLAAPLASRGRVLGTLLLWREGDNAPTYSGADQAYVADLARRLAVALLS